MRLLALDLATTTGWAYHDSADHYTRSGSASFAIRTQPTKSVSADFAGLRFRLFRDWLVNRIQLDRVELIAYEGVVGGARAGGNTSLIQKGFEALLLEGATHRHSSGWNHCGVWSFAPATIKKWATGDGRLTHESKGEMVASARKEFAAQEFVPHRPTKSQPWAWDDNQCDALWLLDLSLAVWKVAHAEQGNLALLLPPEALTSYAHRLTLAKWPRTKAR